jgi:catechol 2,3-dioxygenase-like lactoylglutathione lyase family enzyme
VTGARVHHSAVVVGDVETSLLFYRDGIGLDVLMDRVFEGDWPTLFDVPSTTLRSIFLGDRHRPDAGLVELVVLESSPPVEAAPPPPHPGFFLLSFYVDVDDVLRRLTALGFGPARRISQPGPAGPVAMATLHDPDGVRIELIGVTTG